MEVGRAELAALATLGRGAHHRLRALKRAGIVTGYTHVCRWTTCRFTEERGDSEIRPCPRCGMKLWPKGNVREIRFHDLPVLGIMALIPRAG